MRADHRPPHASEGDRVHRRVERTEGLLTWLLCVLVIAGVVGAFLSAVAVRSGVLERVRSQSHDRAAVAAVVEQSSLVPGDQGVPAERMATVRWRGADGAGHTGTTTVPTTAADGDQVTVWVTAGGRVVGPPATAWDATAAAVLVGLMAGALVALMTWMLAQVFSRWTSRRYADCWQADWDRVGPDWTARGHAA